MKPALRLLLNTFLGAILACFSAGIFVSEWREVIVGSRISLSGGFASHAPFVLQSSIAFVMAYFYSARYRQKEGLFAWVLPSLWFLYSYLTAPVEKSVFAGLKDNRFEWFLGTSPTDDWYVWILRQTVTLPLFTSMFFSLGVFFERANVFRFQRDDESGLDAGENFKTSAAGDTN